MSNGKSSINGSFPIAMFVYWKISHSIPCCKCLSSFVLSVEIPQPTNAIGVAPNTPDTRGNWADNEVKFLIFPLMTTVHLWWVGRILANMVFIWLQYIALLGICSMFIGTLIAAKQQTHKDVLTFLPRGGRFKRIQQGRIADNAALDAGHDRLEDVQSLPGKFYGCRIFRGGQRTWNLNQHTNNIKQPGEQNQQNTPTKVSLSSKRHKISTNEWKWM